MRSTWQRLPRIAVAGTVLAGAVTLIAGYAHLASARAPTAAATAAWTTLGDAKRWPPGLEQRYELEAVIGVQAAAAAPLALTMKSRLTIRVLAVHGTRTELWMKLDLPRVSINGAHKSTADTRDLEQPFLAVCDPAGKLIEYKFSPQASRQSRNLLRLLAAETQLVAPATVRGQRTWSAREQDGMGEYLASYELTAEPRRVTKRKSRYVRAASAASDTQRPIEILDSKKRFDLDVEGQIERLVTEERSKARIAESEGLEMTLRLSLVRSNVAPRKPSPSIPRDWVSAGTANDVEDAATALALADERLLAGARLGELLTQLEKAGDDNTRDDAQRRLEALFRSDPTAIDELETRGSRATPRGTEERILQALADSGTARGQAVLCKLVADLKTGSERRQSALRALAFARPPAAESLRAVARVLDDRDASVRETAALTLGSLVHASAASDSASSRLGLAELARRFDHAATASQRRMYLDALGNAGLLEAVASIERGLQSKTDVERAHAAKALRLIESPRAKALLEKVMLTDAASTVRAAAVFGATFVHHAGTVSALGKTAQTDPNTAVRTAAIHALGKLATRSKEAERFLRELSTRDPNPKLKSLAGQYLFGRRRANADTKLAGSTSAGR